MNEMINSTLEFLYGLHSRGIKLGLKNIESFCSVFDFDMKFEEPHQSSITAVRWHVVVEAVGPKEEEAREEAATTGL